MPDIHHIFPVKATPQRVFEGFCLPANLDNWWPLRSAGTPKLDDVYTFYFGPEYDWRAKVTHLVPGQALTWTMTQAMPDWIGTQVGFTLKEINGVTQVSFFHKGWAEASEHFGITTFCWGYLLNGLKNYLEHGVVIPHHLRN